VWKDGTLACSYHGWRFEGSGACKAIPQAASAAAETTAAGTRRACAVGWPIQEQQGMVLIWGEGGPAAFKESAQQEPPLCPLTEEAKVAGE
jgi:phenylpropionate dioxygenase-like ring-hydroxylating dioxygenase large terminal subunit